MSCSVFGEENDLDALARLWNLLGHCKNRAQKSNTHAIAFTMGHGPSADPGSHSHNSDLFFPALVLPSTTSLLKDY